MKFGSMRRDTQKEKVFARFSSSKPIRPKIKSNLKKQHNQDVLFILVTLFDSSRD